MSNDINEFKVLLNGQDDIHRKLEDFKFSCDSYEKKCLKRKRKHRYYSLGLVAKIEYTTTEVEMQSLLKHGIRTFVVDSVTNKSWELDEMVMRINNGIALYRQLDPYSVLVTSLVLEINGDSCRLGRMHNNCSVLIGRGDIMTLTVSESYRYSSFRQIAYVINLKYYIAMLQLGVEVALGPEVRGRVVKCLKDNVAIQIECAGIINSYDYLELPNECYLIRRETLPDLMIGDLELAAQYKANYILMPQIRCKSFLKAIAQTFKDFKLIGSFDLQFIRSKSLDVRALIKLLDYLWIPYMFSSSYTMQEYIYDSLVPVAKSLKKPIIGTVPLERCSEFKAFENHHFLWKIDAIYMQKSDWCNKYPLIVKKLLPVKDFRIGMVENEMTVTDILTSYQSIVNFIIRTISSIECHAIVIYSKCETAAAAMGRTEIYCPVFVVIPLEDEDENIVCKMSLARALNLRRNLRSIVYTQAMNEKKLRPLDYGIDYARKCGQLDTGDFVITLEIRKEDSSETDEGVGDDVVLLRAYYLTAMTNS